MPTKRRPPSPHDRLHNWIVTRLRKGEYAGTIQARDEAEALKVARQRYAENPHEAMRIAVRRESEQWLPSPDWRCSNDRQIPLNELHTRWEAKFNEICELLARQLGLDPNALSPEKRAEIAQEAEELTENWIDAEHEDWELKPSAPMQRLLKEHSEIGEEILDREAEEFDKGRFTDDE